MHVIVGLGNKGEKYKDTRHNVGRRALEMWVHARGDAFVPSSAYGGKIAKGAVGECEYLALLPETFMNESGGSVAKAVLQKEDASQLIVLYDDIDLPLGTFRVSFDRGSGGHNGVKSIAQSLDTQAFVRIRIGISPCIDGVIRKPKGEDAVVRFVLSAFGSKENEILATLYTKIGESIEHILVHGHQSAMNQFNAT